MRGTQPLDKDAGPAILLVMARMARNDGTLSVAEVAALCAVHPNTIREYERKGLLKAVRVMPGGKGRWYSPEAVEALRKSFEVAP